MNIDPDFWEPPRCIHGHIILGCPEEDCVQQNAYLERQQEALKIYLSTYQLGPFH